MQCQFQCIIVFMLCQLVNMRDFCRCTSFFFTGGGGGWDYSKEEH